MIRNDMSRKSLTLCLGVAVALVSCQQRDSAQVVVLPAESALSIVVTHVPGAPTADSQLKVGQSGILFVGGALGYPVRVEVQDDRGELQGVDYRTEFSQNVTECGCYSRVALRPAGGLPDTLQRLDEQAQREWEALMRKAGHCKTTVVNAGDCPLPAPYL